MAYQHPSNNFKSTLASAHTVGSEQLVLAAGAGSTLGTLAANEVYRLTVLSNPDTSTESVLAIVEATTLTGDTLSGLTFVEGYSDVVLPQNSGVQVRATAKTFSQIHGTLNTLQSGLSTAQGNITTLQGAVTPLQTGLSTAQGNITTLQSQVSSLTSISETSISSATTLLAGGSYVCLGTSPYTVTLPTAVGVTGQTIHLRMSSSLTKFVTVATTSSQMIDGQATRIMYANENATLMSDGANWVKVGGRSIPMTGAMRLVANQAVTASSPQTPILWNGTEIDNTGMMCDASVNKRITIQRPGTYRVSLYAVAYQSQGTGSVTVQMTAGGKNVAYVSQAILTGATQSACVTRLLALNAGDTVTTLVGSNVAFNVLGDPTSNSSYLDVSEVITW